MGCTGGSHGVFGVGLATATPALAVRAVDFDHRDSLFVEVSGEPGAVAAGVLHAHELEAPKRLSQHRSAR